MIAALNTSPPIVGIGLRHPHYAAVLGRAVDAPLPLDFLEVHAENFFAHGGAIADVLDQAAQRYPISLHGVGLSLGSASGLDNWHLEQLKRLVNRINPVLVSDHACFGRALLNGEPAHANDLLPIRHTHAALDVLCANVSQVQDTLGRRIAVENISAYLRWDDVDYSEPDFLNALTQRTGCGVLMDLNNIYVNALNDVALKPTALISCMDWVNAVRADSVMEVHLAGFTPSDTLVIDDHAMPVHASVWQLYRHALAKLGQVPTLIEWDLDVPELSVLLAEADTARQYASAATG
jgi:uncharacterized protein (UPF0276 family)